MAIGVRNANANRTNNSPSRFCFCITRFIYCGLEYESTTCMCAEQFLFQSWEKTSPAQLTTLSNAILCPLLNFGDTNERDNYTINLGQADRAMVHHDDVRQILSYGNNNDNVEYNMDDNRFCNLPHVHDRRGLDSVHRLPPAPSTILQRSRQRLPRLLPAAKWATHLASLYWNANRSQRA